MQIRLLLNLLFSTKQFFVSVLFKFEQLWAKLGVSQLLKNVSSKNSFPLKNLKISSFVRFLLKTNETKVARWEFLFKLEKVIWKVRSSFWEILIFNKTQLRSDEDGWRWRKRMTQSPDAYLDSFNSNCLFQEMPLNLDELGSMWTI